MSDTPDVPDLPEIDEPPRDGTWRDAEVDIFGQLTPEEIAEGNRQGAEIDPDDDEDGTEDE